MRLRLPILLLLAVGVIVFATDGATADSEFAQRRQDLLDRLDAAELRERPVLLVKLARLVWLEDSESSLVAADEAVELATRFDDTQSIADAHEIKGRTLLAMDRYAESLPEMAEAEDLYRLTGDRLRVAKCLGYQGMALSSLGELWPAIEHVEKAAVIFRALGNQKGIAAATNNLGASLERVGEYDRSLALHLESLEIERSLGRTIGIANNLNSIGNVHSRLENLDQARQHYTDALELFEEIDDANGIIQTLNNIGNTYEDQDLNGQALDYYERALERAEGLDQPSVEANPLTNLGIVYKKLGEYDRSLEMYHRAAEIEEAMGEMADLALTLQNIGELQLLMDQPHEALRSLERSESIAISTQAHAPLAGTYRTQAEAHARLGDHRRAYEALVRYDEVRETALADEKHRTVSELQARYDADRRREEIELLTKDNEIQVLQLSRARLTVGLTVAVLLVVVGAVLLLLRRYRSLLAFWKKKVFVGPYRIGEEISSGGMGVVYQATNVLEPGRTVALKVIRDEFAGDETQRRRFINEGQIIDSINHPNIVTVYDRGEHNERLYIAMEYLAGRTLAEVIGENSGRGMVIDERRCLRIMRQLVDALTSIHAMGIVHRDIKPNNVMVTGAEESADRVKLLDFGTAKLDTMTTLTAAGELVGTVSYLAPERIRHHEPTAASDIFSLGVVFYELLTLERPFPADDPVVVLKQILDAEPVAPDVYRTDAPPGLPELVMAMLNKDPDRRPSGEELIHRLARFEAEAA